MENRVENEIREVVLQIACALRFERYAVWLRCDRGWRRRVCNMEYYYLKREMKRLLAQCGFRRIARFYERIFRHSPASILIVGEYVTQLGMQAATVLQPLMNAYNEETARANLLADISEDEEENNDAIQANSQPLDLSTHRVIISNDEQRSNNVEQSASANVEEGEEREGEGSSSASDNESDEEEGEGSSSASDNESDEEEYSHSENNDDTDVDDDVNNDADAAAAAADDESTRESVQEQRFRLLRDHVINTFKEPVAAVARVFSRATQQEGETSNPQSGDIILPRRSQLLTNFYHRIAPVEERRFYTTVDGQAVLNYFDERNPLHRGMNELIRRYLNASGEGFSRPLQTINSIPLPFRHVMYIRRAQEIRWFHDQALDENSPLYTYNDDDLSALLSEIHESFNGRSEE